MEVFHCPKFRFPGNFDQKFPDRGTNYKLFILSMCKIYCFMFHITQKASLYILFIASYQGFWEDQIWTNILAEIA